MHEGQTGSSACAEITAEAEVDTGEDAVPHITTEILSSKANDCRAVGSIAISEEGNDPIRRELDCDCGEYSESHG